MKLPRISLGAIMAGLVVIAADFAVFRSFWSRPIDSGELTWIVWATLPMANLLAVGAALLARGRVFARPSLAGFEVGGWSALVLTPFGLEPGLDRLGEALESTGLIPRIFATIPEPVFDLSIVAGVPFLLQSLVGLACGWLARRIASRKGSRPAVEPGPGRFAVRSLAVLVVLMAIPAVAVEWVLGREVDPVSARLAEGSEAVIALNGSGILPQQSLPNSLLRLVGAKVRVESDREPNLVEVLRMPMSPKIIRDGRSIRTMLLDGPQAGELVTLPRFLLRPDRPRSGREVGRRLSVEGSR